MKVAVLGSGPSGMIAVHAAATEILSGGVDCFAPGEKSTVYGAQYLHSPIPYVPGGMKDPVHIRYIMEGSPSDYLRKVYGDKWDGTINDEMRAQAHLGWDIRQTYDWLWDEYAADSLNPMTITSADDAASFVSALDNAGYDIIINTIPRTVFCSDRTHQFKSVPIYAMGDTFEHRVPFKPPEGQVIYDGTGERSWYRASTINGYSTVEWPGTRSKPPYEGLAEVKKPLGHSCNCLTEFPKLHHFGRMGRWQNGALAHHVYADTVEAIRIAEERY